MPRIPALLAVFTLASSLVAGEVRRPNLVLFLVDDMGWMDSEPYGSRYYETPNLVRLAAQSMRFTDAYALPLCSPTRATILSGQYSARHRVTSASGHRPADPEDASSYPAKAPPTSRYLYPVSKNYLDPALAVLPERLKDAGYRTGHFGKWHLGIAPEHGPDRRGFETVWYAVPDPGPPSYFSPYGVKSEGEPKGRSKIGTITDGPEGEYIVDRLTDEALKFIETHRDEPFFLNLWQYGLHGPWGHKESYTAEFAKKTDPSGLQGNPIMASMIRSIDESVGRVLDKLDELGIAGDTLFVFLSDNGGNVHSNRSEDRKTANLPPGHPKEAFLADWRKWAGGRPPTNNTPLREGKGRIYEGGQRVPLIVRWPGRVAPGTTSDAVVGAVDLLPTLLAAAGVDLPGSQPVDGLSLLPVLEGKGGLDREAYFTWFPHQIPAVSVRSGDWKLIRRWEPHRDYPDLLELYDLKNDLGETRNLAKEHPGKAAELSALIDRFIEETGAYAPIPNPAFREEGGTVEKAALDALKPRDCEIELVGGALRVIGTGRQPFLGTGGAKLAGPLRVGLRLRAPEGGTGRLQWKTEAQEAFTQEGQVVDYTLSGGGEWEELSLELPVEGALGILRIHLPAAGGKSVEIGSIRIEGAGGKARAWDFSR